MSKIKFHVAKVFEGYSVEEVIFRYLDHCKEMHNLSEEQLIEMVSKDDMDPCFRIIGNDIDEESLNEECASLIKKNEYDGHCSAKDTTKLKE